MRNRELYRFGIAPFNLRLFEGEDGTADAAGATETAPAEETDKQTDADGDKPDSGAQKAQEKRYSDAEVDAIVRKKLAKAKAEQEEAVKSARAEAEKLAKMNSEQKRQYEAEKKDQQIKEYEAEIKALKHDQLRAELSKQAARIMKDDHDIVATQDMLDFVVGEDAEDTKDRITKLVTIIQDDRKAQDERRARGTTPKSYGSGKGETDPFAAIMRKYKK